MTLENPVLERRGDEIIDLLDFVADVEALDRHPGHVLEAFSAEVSAGWRGEDAAPSGGEGVPGPPGTFAAPPSGDGQKGGGGGDDGWRMKGAPHETPEPLPPS